MSKYIVINIHVHSYTLKKHAYTLDTSMCKLILIYIYIHVWICIHAWAQIYPCMCMYWDTHVHIHIHAHLCTKVYMCAHLSMHIYIERHTYLFVHICVCTLTHAYYVYIHMHSHDYPCISKHIDECYEHMHDLGLCFPLPLRQRLRFPHFIAVALHVLMKFTQVQHRFLAFPCAAMLKAKKRAIVEESPSCSVAAPDHSDRSVTDNQRLTPKSLRFDRPWWVAVTRTAKINPWQLPKPLPREALLEE